MGPQSCPSPELPLSLPSSWSGGLGAGVLGKEASQPVSPHLLSGPLLRVCLDMGEGRMLVDVGTEEGSVNSVP